MKLSEVLSVFLKIFRYFVYFSNFTNVRFCIIYRKFSADFQKCQPASPAFTYGMYMYFFVSSRGRDNVGCSVKFVLVSL